MSKSILKIIYSCFVQKNSSKKTKYSRNENILKIGQHACKGFNLAHAKSSLWLKNSNSKKHVKIHCTNHLQLFCGKKPLQKNTKYSRNESILIIGHHACKGNSPCKIVTLAQKLKFQKTCQNPFYKSVRVDLWKKPLQKTLNIREMRAF